MLDLLWRIADASVYNPNAEKLVELFVAVLIIHYGVLFPLFRKSGYIQRRLLRVVACWADVGCYFASHREFRRGLEGTLLHDWQLHCHLGLLQFSGECVGIDAHQLGLKTRDGA